jgi:pimeloyl-ACP methyl ester carboxylesterase
MSGVYQVFDARVTGGPLRVGRWGNGRRVVLAAHGLTASHVWFRILADQLGDDFSLVAPDLRGRGASHEVGGPFSIGQHAEDMIGVLDQLGASAEVAVGHSMGAWVAILLADRYPSRVGHLVLIDGGLPKPVTPVGPILERLKLTFPTVEAYLDRWRSHPALAGNWNDYLAEAYIYDLQGEPPHLRARVQGDAIAADQESVSRGSQIADALGRLRHRADLVVAPRGIFDEPEGLYSAEALAYWTSRVPRLRTWPVPGTNHYTILTSAAGSRLVTELIQDHLGAGDSGPHRQADDVSGRAETSAWAPAADGGTGNWRAAPR